MNQPVTSLEIIPTAVVKEFITSVEELKKTCERLATENLQLRLHMTSYRISDVAAMIGNPTTGSKLIYQYLKSHRSEVIMFGKDRRQVRIPGPLAMEIIDFFKTKYKEK